MKKVATVLLIAFIAITVAAARRCWGLSLSPEIRVVDLATLFLTLFVAVFLQYYLATQINDRRVEKNLLLDGVRDAISVLRGCRDTFLTCCGSAKMTKRNASSMLMMLRALSNGIESLETAISMSQFASLRKEVLVVKEKYLDYKMVLTGGDFPPKAYSPGVSAEHERAYRSLRVELQSLMFKINRSR